MEISICVIFIEPTVYSIYNNPNEPLDISWINFNLSSDFVIWYVEAIPLNFHYIFSWVFRSGYFYDWSSKSFLFFRSPYTY